MSRYTVHSALEYDNLPKAVFNVLLERGSSKYSLIHGALLEQTIPDILRDTLPHNELAEKLSFFALCNISRQTKRKGRGVRRRLDREA
jgi:hypothetical protein